MKTCGGLPLLGWRVGVLQANDDTKLIREESIQAGLCSYRLDGLRPDSTQRFVLAASNPLGTSRWSSPSSPVATLVGRPSPPTAAILMMTSAPGAQPEVELRVVPGNSTGGRPLTDYMICLYREGVKQAVTQGRTTDALEKNGSGVHLWKTQLECGGKYTAKVW